MLKLLVFTSWEEMRGSEGGGSLHHHPTPRCSQPLLHLGVRQDDLRDAADDRDEVKDVPGVPEIILQKKAGERDLSSGLKGTGPRLLMDSGGDLAAHLYAATVCNTILCLRQWQT